MGVKRLIFAVLFVGFIASHADAQFNRHRRRGTLIGGLAGAALGAAITDRNDNETAGVLIGGATGALIGRSIGAERDRQLQQNHQYYRHYPYAQVQRPVQPSPVVVAPVPVITPSVPRLSDRPLPISQADVVSMVQSGLSEKLIAAEIQRRGIGHRLEVQDIIYLHQQGVSEWLIQWMQNSIIPNAPTLSQYSAHSHQVESQTSYQLPPQAPPQQLPTPIVPADTRAQGMSYGTSIIAPPVSAVELNSAN